MLEKFMKNNKNIEKLFTQKEIEIVRKQLEGIKLTQSEKNRLSRDIRPKLKIIKEISKFEDEFELKNNQKNKKIIEKALSTILNNELKKNIKAILLFGSFADNTFTQRSDIDICVLFKRKITLTQATKFRIRISGQLPNKVDIQVFDFLPFKIKKEIAKNHQVLYKTKDYDNINFTIKYLKDNDYNIRMREIFGIEA